MSGQKQLFTPRDLLAAQSTRTLRRWIQGANMARIAAGMVCDGPGQRDACRLMAQLQRELQRRKENREPVD